jgi:N6-adenosine-specific RNA methylase IME4
MTLVHAETGEVVSSVPAIPDPASATIEHLKEACLAVRVWADQCDDIEAACEAHDRITAIERYLTRKGKEAEAQEAARWLEVRIGELLGPDKLSGGRGLKRPHADGLPRQRVAEFQKLAEHRPIVAELVPTSRRRILVEIERRQLTPTIWTTEEGLPKEFVTITADPPWQYDNKATRGAAEDHYGTMSLDELTALDIDDLPELGVPVADNAHLYLWVTNGFLRQGFDVVEAWGFTYKACLTWIKPQIGTGNYFRNATEHVLFGIRGRLPTNANDIPTWFRADRTRHSAKPDSFFDLVEKSSPGPYLEIFGRYRRRFGWWHWGNEA